MARTRLGDDIMKGFAATAPADAAGCLCPNVLILEKGDNWIYG
jgi:hypothetical protein